MESGMSEPLRRVNGNKIPNITLFDNSKKDFWQDSKLGM